MSRTEMQQAQQLIKQGRYDDARRILEKIDTLQARDWLAKLDKRAPRQARRRSGGAVGRILGGFVTMLLTVILSVAATSALLAGLIIVSAPTRNGENAVPPTEVAEVPTDTPTPAWVGTVRSGQNINVRSGPSTSTDSIASLVPGATVEILGESDDGEWYNVRLPNNGGDGWVSANLLDASPPPTTVSQNVTSEPGATAVPGSDCAPEVAQAWYDANSMAVNRISFTLMQAENAKKVDYNKLSAMVRENKAAFESADAPDCVSELRSTLLVAFQAVDNSYQNTLHGFPNDAKSEMNIAMEQYERAIALIVELGIVPGGNDCGAEIWYAGIQDDVALYLSMIENISITTAPSQEIRTAIFDLQELLGRIEVAYPDCAAAANDHLLNSVHAAVKLFQAIMAQDTVANKQTQLTAMVSEANEFINEMRQLGIRVA